MNPNIIVAFSNFIAIPFFIFSNQNILYLIPCLASFFYHLGSRKNGFPGIKPFRRYEQELLWIDRIIAVLSIIYVLSQIHRFTIAIYILGVIAVICCLISDGNVLYKLITGIQLDMSRNPYIIFHCIWHISAFIILDRLLL
jgi:hypothetical protein